MKNQTNTMQKKAFEKLSKLKAGALFMKMGTGKTKVALDLIESKQGRVEGVLWLAPASLLVTQNYKDELNKWNQNITIPFYFYSIEGISQSDNKYMEIHNLSLEKKLFCVIDESLAIKNTDSKRTNRLLKLRDNFSYRLILNGTPVTKSLLDMYSQINFLHPKILNMSEAQFANHFLFYEKGGFNPWKRWSKPENEEALIEIIRPYIFDADLEIKAQKNDEKIEVFLNQKEREDYEDFKINLLKNRFSRSKVDFLAIAQSLQKQYSSCEYKNKSMVNVVRDILENKEKVIIFTKFIKEVNSLFYLLSPLAKTVKLTGSSDKKEVISSFEKEADIMIATYGTGAKGLNLQFCTNIIFYSQTFDWGQKEQAIHRIYRKGQEKDVFIYDYFCHTGLEKIIEKSLEKKEDLYENLKKIILEKKWDKL